MRRPFLVALCATATRRGLVVALCVALGAVAAVTVVPVGAAFVATTVNPGNTLAASATFPTYPQAVTSNGPTRYHRLGDTVIGGVLGNTVTAASFAHLDTGLGYNRPGATGDGDGALSLNGTTTLGAGGWGPSIAARTTAADPQTFTVECWFATSAPRGGELFGFGDQRKALSSTYDRMVYLTDAGKLVYGVYPGYHTVTSAASYNDGAWHHVAASFGASGMQLHVDGVLIGTNATPTAAQHTAGYWRLGGDRLTGWTTVPGSNYFEGVLDEFAVYPTQLTQARLAAHIAAAAGAGYPAAVAADSPYLHWRLGGTDPTTVAADASGQGHPGWPSMRPYATPTQSAGAVFTGDTSFIVGRQSYANPAAVTVECWFRSTGTTGGRLIGFGDSKTATSAKSDRHLYLTDAGKVAFGAGTNSAVQSPSTYTDGALHHAAGSVGPAGLKLYVDGVLVATNAGVTAGQVTTGYWRVGGDQLTGWPAEPTNPFPVATVAGASAYVSQLSDADIATRFAGGAVAGAVLTWNLLDASFAAGAVDSSGTGDTGTASAPRYTAGATGPMKGNQTPTTAMHFTGAAGAWVPVRVTNPLPFTVECWFRTTTTTGGVLVNFGDQRVTGSTSRDRFLYLGDDGRLNFGVYNGAVRTVRTAAAFNDGTWHHAVASIGARGLSLSVDGTVRATDATVTTAENFTGFWRLAGDTVGGGWPYSPTTPYLTGDLAEFAVYPAQLTDQQMREHFHANH